MLSRRTDGPVARSDSASVSMQRRSRRVPVAAIIFLIAVLLPFHVYVGPLRLSPYRAVLLLAVIPSLLLLVGGRVGRVQIPDVLIILSACWAALALTVVHGVPFAVEPAGIHFIETVGAYLLARCYITGRARFVTTARFLFYTVVALLPFAIIESVTGSSIPLAVLSRLGPTISDGSIGGRFGLERAQVVFDHPILYGVFCAVAFSLTWYVVCFRRSTGVSLISAGLVGVATFFSLSAGAFAAVIVQIALIAWEFFTRGVRKRWKWLSLLAIVAYFTIDILSNRSPFHVLVTYLTFNVQSAYNRILIWQYGSAEVWRHPVFGIGLGDWERPSFMSSSMDNFWLVIAVRFGIPAFLLFAAAVAMIFYLLGAKKITDAETRSCRLGILVTIGGLIIAGTTVHYWNAIYSVFMFLLGSGMWILREPETVAVRQSSRELPAKHTSGWLRSRRTA
jgi:O-antigen ligase